MCVSYFVWHVIERIINRSIMLFGDVYVCVLCRLPIDVPMPLNCVCNALVHWILSYLDRAKWRQKTCFANKYILFNIGFFLPFMPDAVSFLIALLLLWLLLLCSFAVDVVDVILPFFRFRSLRIVSHRANEHNAKNIIQRDPEWIACACVFNLC